MSEEWAEKFCTAYHVDPVWFRTEDGEPVFIKRRVDRKGDAEDADDEGDVEDAHSMYVRTSYASVGKRLSQMREELGLTQIAVCDAIGMKRINYSRLENGHSRLTVENARKIEDAFGYGADWICTVIRRRRNIRSVIE